MSAVAEILLVRGRLQQAQLNGRTLHESTIKVFHMKLALMCRFTMVNIFPKYIAMYVSQVVLYDNQDCINIIVINLLS